MRGPDTPVAATIKSVRGVVFISAKADNFIAGADINMIARCRSAQEAEALARQGNRLWPKSVACRFGLAAIMAPVWAAVCWSWRWPAMAASVAMTKKPDSGCRRYNGLLPGSGGTQRLPRLIGVSTALDMMLTTGRQLRPRQALRGRSGGRGGAADNFTAGGGGAGAEGTSDQPGGAGS